MTLPPLVRHLRLPALQLAIVLILGVGLLAWALSTHENSAAALARASAGEVEAARAAGMAPGNLRKIQRESDLYEQIQRLGFQGAEQRARWVTALGRTQARLGLDSVAWRLEPASASALAPGLRVSAMEVSVSRVNVDGLAAFLDGLRASGAGRFTVERCALVLDPDGQGGQADCGLLWWTWDAGHGPR